MLSYPIGCGKKLICHVVNISGVWHRGFVISLSKRWEAPEAVYLIKSKQKDFALGQVQFIQVENDIIIANMVAQKGSSWFLKPVAVKYTALHECLEKVFDFARTNNINSIHMPRIGCGLAGGSWNEVGKIVEAIFKDIETYVYDLPS